MGILLDTSNHRADLVISDVFLPRRDGFELVHERRAVPAIAGTSVSFYTGVFDEKFALADEMGLLFLKSINYFLAQQWAFLPMDSSSLNT